MSDPKRGKGPERIDRTVSEFLKDTGLEARVEAATVVPEWERLVGREISLVTEPLYVTADGTLFVAVSTHAWMTELQLLEPGLLAALNVGTERPRVRRLRFQLLRRE